MDLTPSPHPLVTAHLDEVDTLLRGLPPAERSEVMEGIRAETTTSVARLGADPTDAEVEAAVARLGSPRSIADKAYADRKEAGHPRQAIAPGNGDALAESWVPVAVAALGAGALVAIGYLAVTLAAVATGRWVLFAWVGIVLLSSMSPLWSRGETVLLIGLVPVGWALVAVPGRFGHSGLAVAGGVAAAALFGVLLPRLVLRGRERAQRHPPVGL
ncbi:hypothetical protein BA895_16875 [Humibacillus sp. DSM 29435]|uniref:HAAS signaling domain-containing protein n=1 Tax=Humibacillus sp. DSM 29435 TaxID=1869167 RepID=UPI0008723903|nr:hypothetical protein [Humibacillus sp. DSM 29435]OFE17144.1 hypothetical protein BA895_16875 [Humibacillus sp. DSM 29435]